MLWCADNFRIVTLCPGALSSQITRDAPRFLQPLIRSIFSLFFPSPLRAAEPVVYLPCASGMEKRSGLYLHRMTRKKKGPRARQAIVGRYRCCTEKCWYQAD